MPTKKSALPRPSDHSDSADSFESAVAELRQIVNELEGGELDLTASLASYERGIRRLKHCQQFLEAAELKISQLVSFDADGNPVLQSVEASLSEELTEKQHARGHRRSAKSSSTKPAISELPELF